MVDQDKDGLLEWEFLQQYDPGEYPRPSVATDMVIFTVTDRLRENYRKLPEKELRILLIRRGVHPYLGKWALPGGFVRSGESTEQTAQRELAEETGVEGVYLEQLHTFSDPKRDPRGWVMSCSYMALIDSSSVNLKAGDDADETHWFSVRYALKKDHKEILENGLIREQEFELTLTAERELSEQGLARQENNTTEENDRREEDLNSQTLSAVICRKTTRTGRQSTVEYQIRGSNGFAFDHAKIIALAVERLRGKVEGTDIAFHLMPELFTLTELQQVYEVILDQELLKANFRRKMAGVVVETDLSTENAGHRPSRLYRRNPTWNPETMGLI